MEAERLKSVIDAVLYDNDELNTVALLTNLETAYTQSVQSPNAQTAQAFETSLSALRDAMTSSACSTLSAGRLRVLAQLNAQDLCGNGLVTAVELHLQTGQSPADVVRRLQTQRKRAQTFHETAKALSDSLNKLGIRANDPPEAAAEVEVAIPAKLIDSGLASLAREAKSLDRALGDIIESSTGSRPPLKISGLGTGSVEVYVTVDPVSGVAVLALVTAVINLINSLLQTRKSRLELESQSAPKNVLDTVRNWEQEKVEAEIKRIVEDLSKRSPLDKHRKTEMRKALGDSVKWLADRIDRGLDIDVTTSFVEPEPSPEGAEAKAPGTQQAASREIADAAGTLAHLPRSPEPVLLLPAPAPLDEAPAETQPAKDK